MDSAQTTKLENGLLLRYRRFGSGPSLIFLHGYPETHSVWYDLMKRLSSNYHVLAFDWPGMGGSEAWSGGATPKNMASRIVKIMDHFQIEHTHLMGHDMGGQPSLVCAGENPQRILSVTVINSLLIHNAETSWEIKYLRNLTLNKFFLTQLPRIVFRRALGTFSKNEKDLSDDLRSEFWEYFQKKDVRNYIVRMCFGYQAQLPKLARYYSKITCPVLALWSEDNKHFSVDHGIQLQKITPQTSVETIAGSSHWLGYFKVDKTEKLWKSFLNK